MSLTQEQIDQCGEAFNDAMGKDISVELRGRLVEDLRHPTVGDVELIAGTRKVMLSAYTGYRASLAAYLAILTSQPTSGTQSPPPVVTPPPVIQQPSGSYPIGAYKLEIRPLTSNEVTALLNDLQKATAFGAISQSTVDRVAQELKRGFYSVQDSALIDQIKFWLYSGNANQDAIKPYLSAIDQRDLATNALLSPTDLRVVQVSGVTQSATVITPPAPPMGVPTAGASGDFIAFLDSIGIYCRNGKIGIGAPPRADFWPQVQIYNEGEAGIGFVTNEAGSNPQWKDANGRSRPRVAVITLSGDGGFRQLTNPQQANVPWFDDVRASTMMGPDGAGDMSWWKRAVGVDRGPQSGQYCQDMVLTSDEGSKEMTFVSMRPGWRIGFKWSNAIRDFANKWLP